MLEYSTSNTGQRTVCGRGDDGTRYLMLQESSNADESLWFGKSDGPPRLQLSIFDAMALRAALTEWIDTGRLPKRNPDAEGSEFGPTLVTFEVHDEPIGVVLVSLLRRIVEYVRRDPAGVSSCDLEAAAEWFAIHMRGQIREQTAAEFPNDPATGRPLS